MEAERTFISYQRGSEMTGYGPAEGSRPVGEGVHSLGKWRGSSNILLGLGIIWDIWKREVALAAGEL